MNSSNEHKLSIVIPAYNEEEAIASIIERSLASRKSIIEKCPVSSVEIMVVNDGSRDRTPQIAGQYRDIRLIDHEANKGYGAAIKTGFDNATGDILGFLDADGTCDPEFFATLCRMIIEQNADIAIGSRMNLMSEMPGVRKLGNWIFARIISFLGSTRITDSASGMRVLRRDSLGKIYPLPDGLHFTPAMSTRAVLDRNIKIVETPMPYKERTGRSKLSVFRDGLRFSKTIFDVALTQRPFKFFGVIGVLFLVLALLYGIQPVAYYINNQEIAEYMIYRLITVMVLALSAIVFLALGILADRIVALINDYEPWHGTRLGKILDRYILSRTYLIAIVLIMSGVLLNLKTIYQYVTSGHIYVHWVYILTGALLVLAGIQLLALSILGKIIRLLKEKLDFGKQRKSK